MKAQIIIWTGQLYNLWTNQPNNNNALANQIQIFRLERNFVNTTIQNFFIGSSQSRRTDTYKHYQGLQPSMWNISNLTWDLQIG